MEQSDPKSLFACEGVLETIIYTSEETHFTVARLRENEDSPCITIVGTIMATNQGERVRVSGYWVNHPKYGKQLSVQAFYVVLPTGKEAIRDYLASGIVKGIGESLADKIVKHFGEDTFTILDKEPEKIMEIPGIGKKKKIMILNSWKSQRGIHEAMLFLSQHGIRGVRAAKICDYYSGNVISVLKNHPYRLALDIDGIGFTIADQIARKVGLPEDDPERMEAALVHVLKESHLQGHCYLPEARLLQNTQELLRLSIEKIEPVLSDMVEKASIYRLDQKEKPVYTKNMYFYENKVAELLTRIAYNSTNRIFPDVEITIDDVEKEMRIHFEGEQRRAVRDSLKDKICIITGGPGVGKTTIIRALVHILNKRQLRIALAAPTGRAAKRLSEATDSSASTIHRLLKFNPHKGKFEQNSNSPLEVDHVIIDETSMVDISLAYYLLSALPKGAGITFVGDADQLPSVGPGNFLADMISSEFCQVVRLTKIFRQAEGSSIVHVAHKINSGEIPVINNHPESDIFFLQEEDAEKGANTIVELLSQRLPKRYGFCPLREIQILTPMYRGDVGADNLNRLLADALNKEGRALDNKEFREGDKVMQIVNNYEKDIYNGDIGIIESFNKVDKTLTIRFDNRGITYQESELDEVVRAYAISIHKSQGSEYPAVVIPLFNEHYIMLERNLVYTAITRGKKLVVLLGNWRALQIAIKKIRARSRYTLLAELLRDPGSIPKISKE